MGVVEMSEMPDTAILQHLVTEGNLPGFSAPPPLPNSGTFEFDKVIIKKTTLKTMPGQQLRFEDLMDLYKPHKVAQRDPSPRTAPIFLPHIVVPQEYADLECTAATTEPIKPRRKTRGPKRKGNPVKVEPARPKRKRKRIIKIVIPEPLHWEG